MAAALCWRSHAVRTSPTSRERDAGGEGVLDQCVGGPRQQDLSPVSRGRDPGSAMDVEARVVIAPGSALPGVQAHSDPDRSGPRSGGDRPLGWATTAARTAAGALSNTANTASPS